MLSIGSAAASLPSLPTLPPDDIGSLRGAISRNAIGECSELLNASLLHNFLMHPDVEQVEIHNLFKIIILTRRVDRADLLKIFIDLGKIEFVCAFTEALQNDFSDFALEMLDSIQFEGFKRFFSAAVTSGVRPVTCGQLYMEIDYEEAASTIDVFFQIALDHNQPNLVEKLIDIRLLTFINGALLTRLVTYIVRNRLTEGWNKLLSSPRSEEAIRICLDVFRAQLNSFASDEIANFIALSLFTNNKMADFYRLIGSNQRLIPDVFSFAVETGATGFIQAFNDERISYYHIMANMNMAIDRGNIDIVRLLMTNPQLAENYCAISIALSRAVELGNRALVGLLMDDPRLTDSNISVALGRAVELGNRELVGLLMDDPRLTDSAISVALGDAIGLGNRELVELLMNHRLIGVTYIIMAINRAKRLPARDIENCLKNANVLKPLINKALFYFDSHYKKIISSLAVVVLELYADILYDIYFR